MRLAIEPDVMSRRWKGNRKRAWVFWSSTRIEASGIRQSNTLNLVFVSLCSCLTRYVAWSPILAGNVLSWTVLLVASYSSHSLIKIPEGWIEGYQQLALLKQTQRP